VRTRIIAAQNLTDPASTPASSHPENPKEAAGPRNVDGSDSLHPIAAKRRCHLARRPSLPNRSTRGHARQYRSPLQFFGQKVSDSAPTWSTGEQYQHAGIACRRPLQTAIRDPQYCRAGSGIWLTTSIEYPRPAECALIMAAGKSWPSNPV